VKSIRARLLGWLLVGLALALAVAGAVSYRQARQEVNDLLDYQLEQAALSLRNQNLLAVAISSEVGQGEDGDLLVQLWDRANGLVYVSQPDRELPFLSSAGFARVEAGGRGWRVYTAQWGPRVVQVAQPEVTRLRLSADIALRNIALFLLLVPLVALAVWLGVGRGLAPLGTLAADIRRRGAESLEPLPLDGLPREIEPPVHAMNELLARLGRALGAQRRFVADVAHELRTPLTALRLQAQLVERAASDAERGEALRALREGLLRASHLAEQLLTLARLDPEAPREREAVDLAALARAVVVEREPMAHARRIDLGLEVDPRHAAQATLAAEPEPLRTLLGNLVDNALRYTPEGGTVQVRVDARDGESVLEVEDSGPGIPAHERERVFDRFYRGSAAQGTGTGLGLAIVKRVAERHGAKIELADGAQGRGLRVVVRFPIEVRPDAR